MTDLQKALATQLANIEKRSGKSLAELAKMLKSSGLSKHGELRDYLKSELGMGHGDANTLVHHVLGNANAAPQAATVDGEDVLAAIYVGAKAPLRPIHEAFNRAIAGFGNYEVAPKKGYVSLRRKKQFAMIGPGTNTRVDLGLNMKSVPGTDRLVEQAPGGMCNYKVKLTSVAEVDAELIGWVRMAYDSAG